MAAAFQCNTSQVNKVVMGIIYKLGPHHYVPKKQCDKTTKKTTKWPGDVQDTNVVQPKKKRIMAKASTSKEGQRSPDTVNRDNTLSTESTSDGDSPLPKAF